MIKETQKGQTIVTLLFFMVISISIVTAVVVVVFNTVVSGGNYEQGNVAYYAAEAGAQNALLRLVRNPSYAGEALTVDGAAVTVTVSSDVITSIAQYGNAIRKIQVETVYNNNMREVVSWTEID